MHAITLSALLAALLAGVAAAPGGTCRCQRIGVAGGDSPSAAARPDLFALPVAGTSSAPSQGRNYSSVLSAGRSQGIVFDDLPGFTRSVYARDHALITPESRVWAGQPGW